MRALLLLAMVTGFAHASEEFLNLVRTQNLEQIETYLDENPTALNYQNEWGESGLMIGVKSRSLGVVELLLDLDADINLVDRDANDVMMLALKREHFDINIFRALPEKYSIRSNNLGNNVYHLASKLCHKEVLAKLYDDKSAIEVQNKSGETPLIVAAKTNCNKAIKELTNRDVNINTLDHSEHDAIHYTFHNNNIEGFELLIQAGAVSPVKDPALFEAIENNDISKVQALIDFGANLNARNDDSETALIVAIKREERIEIARLLINAGADLTLGGYDADTALHHAINETQNDLAKLIADKLETLNLFNADNETPLDWAHNNNNHEMVRFLLEKGAANTIMAYDLYNTVENNDYARTLTFLKQNVYTEYKGNYDNDTPLHRALIYGHYDIAKLLLEFDADVNAVNRYDTHPADRVDIDHELFTMILDRGGRAAKANEFVLKALVENKPEVYRKYVDNITDVNYTDYDYDYTNMLIEATKLGDKKFVKELLKLGPSIDQSDNEGLTALEHAIGTNQLKIAKLLIENNADTSELDITDALDNNSFDTLDFLLELIPELINKRLGYSDYAPLHYAITKNNQELIEYLMKKGADINQITFHSYRSEQQIPLTMAFFQSQALFDMLIAAGADLQAALEILPSRVISSDDAEVYNRLIELGHEVTNDEVRGLIGSKKINLLRLLFTRGHAFDKEHLRQAYVNSNNQEIFKFFLDEVKIDVNQTYEYGNSLLHIQADKYKFAIVLAKSKMINHKNNEGDTPLLAIAKNFSSYYQNHYHKLLLKNPMVDINATDKHHRSALHYSESADNAALLIKAGIDKNIQDRNGDTALTLILDGYFYSIKYAIAQTLLYNQANVLLQNDQGDNAMSLLRSLKRKADDRDERKPIKNLIKLVKRLRKIQRK